MLQRIRRSGVALIALVAPAGYGKSYIAQRIAREDQHAATIDLAVTTDTPSLERALAAVPLLASGGAKGLDALIDAWGAAPEPISLVLESVECASAELLEAIAMLVRARPETGKLIMCTRRALPSGLTEVEAPHLIATLRAEDLRFDRKEMAQLFSETGIDDTALFRATRLTGGWPVVALFVQRLVQEEALDLRDDVVPDHLLDELMDYVDAQAIGKLPPALFRALAAASALGDLTEAEIARGFGRPGAIAELVRIHQLARAGVQDRVEVHPLIRRTVQRRHRHEMVDAMRSLADLFASSGKFARAAECYLTIGDVGSATDCALQVDDGFLTLVGTEHAGSDIATAATSLEIRLALAAARRLIETSRNLPREALSVLEAARGETGALQKAALGIAVLSLIDAGRSDDAVALLEDAPLDGDEAPTGSDLVLLTARLASLAQLGRYDAAMALWRPLRRRVAGNAVWLAQLTRIEVQAARVRARWEVEHEALERMIALARSGGSVPVLALALAETAFGSWLAGEDELFERYQSELMQIIEHHDVPALLRFALAADKREPLIERSDAPLWDARAFLLASAGAPDGSTAARYAQAALDAADRAGEPLTRILVRVCAAEKLGSGQSRLREARELSNAIDVSPLRDAVSALADRGEARGMLAPLVNRLRHRKSIVAPKAGAPLVVSLADGTLWRGEERIDVSEGVLALVVALAIESQPVGRERLVDRVWPDLHDESAYNALKMCVHRTRQQLADPGAVIVTRSGYTLAPEIEVDLRALESALERIRRNADTDEPGLEATFERLVRGRPSFFANWEWFGPIERILESATHEAGAFIAERALRRGDHVRALAIAQMLVKLDPLDEAARRVAIRAHLAANDRGAAILEYRGYKALLHSELDVEPSSDLKHL
ncbi:MAG TPA: BTAD domain-containing putative transcriptional regulator, partial [Candidatus Elarobacter sp.]|nr:BTAD domain-containing putative transcriptional regulator [Candidatus Elarobacter sp.]